MSRVRQGLKAFFAELDLPAGQSPSMSKIKQLANELLTREVLEPTHEYLDYNEKEVEKTSRQNRVQAGRLILALLLLGIYGSSESRNIVSPNARPCERNNSRLWAKWLPAWLRNCATP